MPNLKDPSSEPPENELSAARKKLKKKIAKEESDYAKLMMEGKVKSYIFAELKAKFDGKA